MSHGLSSTNHMTGLQFYAINMCMRLHASDFKQGELHVLESVLSVLKYGKTAQGG